MMHAEPSFALYALLLDPGCCLRAHTVLSGTVDPERKKKTDGLPNMEWKILSLQHSCLSPHQAHFMEFHFIQRYGIRHVMNAILPPLKKDKWDFLTQRKVWKNELNPGDQSLLEVATAIAHGCQPLSPIHTP